MRKFELFGTLTKDEFIRFADFVGSPFFNKRNDLVVLVNYLRSHYPDFELTDEEIYRSVHGDDKFNLQVARNLISRLRELLVKYLTQLGIEKQETFRNMALAYELARKGKAEYVNKIISGGIEGLNSETYTVEYLKKYYDYLETKEDLMSDTKDYKAKVENSLMRGECAVNYFLLSLMRIANEYAVFKHVHRYDDKIELFNGFLNYFDFEKYLQNLKASSSEHYAITAIFYYGLLSKINDPEGINREKLKTIVFENLDKLKLKDQYTCWVMLFASYIFTSSVQKGGVNIEMHAINKVFVEKDLIPRDEMGYVMDNNYHNITIQAVISKDFDWAENFINTYREQLDPARRENVYCVSMATCLFGRKEYERCIEFLSKARVTDIMTNVMLRTTYIRCYYELGYYDEAESAIEAMRIFTYQNKELTSQVKRSLPDFLKYAKLLVKIKAKDASFPEQQFLKAQKTPGFNSRSWVLDKMKELM